MNAYNEPLRKSNATLLHASKTSAEADAIVRGVVEDWVQATHHQRYLLEYVLSALDERPLTFLREWLLGHFPSNAGAYLTRMWQPLLAQLSANLCALANNADTDAESLDDLRRRLQRVQTASPVLEVLSTTIFPESGPSSHAPACRNSPEDTFLEVEEDDDDEALSLGVNITLKRKSQRENKQKRGKRPRQKTIDKGPNLKASELNAFRAYGAPVPQTRREADVLRHEVLDELRQSLTWYLEVVRWPQTHEAVLNAINEELSNPHQPNSSTNEDTRMASPELSRKNLESESETPAAYPMVQPMKAALYFDSVEGFGEWRILVSTRADKKLRETRKKDRETFRIIVKKIKSVFCYHLMNAVLTKGALACSFSRELSTGHFSDDNQKRLNGPDTDIPIFEAKMTRDLRLVYQVDCVPEFGTDGERQVIKIFGIYTHAQLDQRFWNSVGTQLAKKGGKEYKYRCTYRMKPLTKGDNVYLPASFPAPETVVAGPVVELPNVRTEDLDELHALLVLEKFVTFSQAFLNSLLANQDVVHPFAVSSQEQEIIEHPHSCYVIGRSGTGKTTTMLFKMLGLERTWHLHKESMPRPRQVFVTQSRVLATKVEEYFGKMLDSLAAGAQSAKELSKLSTIRTGRDEGLVDLDDEENWRSDLPKRFSELRDEHFPLFITYDKLCKLLEADVETTIQDIGPMNDRLVDEEQTNSNEYMLQKRDSFVSYHVFLESYWSHFPQSLTKGLDPALVFSEFMGIIKGSEQAVLSERSSLDLTAYESLSHRTQSTFARQRGVIYSLFEAYTKQRIQLRQYDAADRTHRLIASLQNQKAGHKKIDYLYVDEVQDNLLIDALLLRMLCVNSNGLFFAGDTAQTISVGSAFRFNDLKAFMHRVEERSRAASNTSIAPAPPVQPRSFQLLVNYRSHGGIVKCASSLIRLIIDFWPYAIDMLDEERGVIDGLKPVFFHGWDKDTVRYEQFLFGDAGAPIEFGAQQCILVRDDAARDRLRADVGDIGLIMTLYESKGLEFNDARVLLYNFFEDSTVDVSQWRVTLNAVDPDARQNAAAPRFDEIKHAGICSELKFLYVAVTRARKNLWVVDCSERGEPMRLLWTSRGLVQSCTPGTDVPKLAVSSTVEEWATAAEALFRSKRFMQAMHAYERAEMQREAAVSHAYHLRDKARSTTTGVLKAARARKEAFAKAARAFLTSAEGATKEKIAYYKIAGQCFVEAEDDVSAAKAFLHAREYTSAAQHFRKAGLFDDAISVIRDHKNDVAEEVAERIVNVARIHYFENEQLEKAAPLFASFEEELEFLEDFDFDIARAKLLESKGRILEAAELHLAEARPLDAIRLFLTDSANPKSLRRAASCLVQGMWTSSPLGTVVGQHGGSLAQFLALSGRLDKAAIAEQHADEASQPLIL
ncbi:P-loop containing nucleoside triphosphate hydrolase protein [Punctularia strigosozonata HHB-11173 SS5]|uniref:P-loop containing nucleoside triphosphate hydrolase protein n=1 Tax=Punctularia strigosozonata (strain HHB-11173) TaxID=741275 RepID=UPI0004418376|nr:P-loop containing nucleoside triphosphate hydrolase protein [Punctularia strigosozonata HHB-11173 SS5]EIN13316.1 P-loop containing nucleoside triphosphate hydrolase protein [Punctularia strigosozonata HHB-11173 SS5]